MPGIVAECVVEQVTVPVKRSNRPGEWLADSGEIVPINASQSARLAELFDGYNTRLVSYARSRLSRYGVGYGEAQTLAEDIVQAVWTRVACNGRKDLLSPGVLDDCGVTGLLFVRTQHEISAHFRRRSSTETAVDWTDAVTCNALCPLLPEGCAAVALPDYLARMVTALPELERQALLYKLDGMHPGLIADHMQCGDTTAARLVSAAVLLLQIDNPELSGPAVAAETLPVWEQEELAKVSATKREALLRLDASTRQAVLLKAQGATIRAIAKQLGVSHELAASAARCAAVLYPVKPTAVPKPRRKIQATRKNSRARQVANILRQEVTGLAPGTKLPARSALKTRFSVGNSTIDNVWSILCDEGLIEPAGICGYRIANHPTDLAVAA